MASEDIVMSIEEIKKLDTLQEKIDAVTSKNELKRSRTQRRENWIYGVLGLFYLALIVLAAVAGEWSSVLTTLGLLALWAGLAYLLMRLLNNQRFTIDQMFDLRKLERQEIEELLMSLEPENLAPKKTKAKKETK